jgi:magnesium transporter
MGFKRKTIFRPDQLLLSGLRSLAGVNINLYSQLKSETKGKAELSFIGEKKLENVETQLFIFNASKASEQELTDDFSILENLEEDSFYWLNFHGVHDVKLLEKLADALAIERLTLRQILDTTQRAKVEEYDGYLHFMVKSIQVGSEHNIDVEHMSFLLTPQIVISFQEQKGDHFDFIRSKMREDVGFIRKRTPDYLMSQLLDAILDNYFESIEILNADVKDYGPQVIIERPHKQMIIALESLKVRAQKIKKSLFPFKEGIQSILNERTRFITEKNVRYFKDLMSSAAAAIDETDELIRTLEGLTNIYFASESQKMNDIMRVLTTVSTIFIPLTFIAGIYGMNFQFMPELTYRYGYYTILGVMGTVTVVMLIYFRRKGWL